MTESQEPSSSEPEGDHDVYVVEVRVGDGQPLKFEYATSDEAASAGEMILAAAEARSTVRLAIGEHVGTEIVTRGHVVLDLARSDRTMVIVKGRDAHGGAANIKR